MSHLNKVHRSKSQLYFLVFQHISAYTADSRELSEDIKVMYSSVLDLPSPGNLRSAEWQFRTDLLGKPIRPIFECEAAQVD